MFFELKKGGLSDMVLTEFCGAGPGITTTGTAELQTETGTNLRTGTITTESVLFFLCAKCFLKRRDCRN